MRTRDEVLSEMVKVAEALEHPNLRPVQKARGWVRYNELEKEFEEIKAAEKAAKIIESPEQVTDPDQPQSPYQIHSQKIREILKPNNGKRYSDEVSYR